MTGLLFLAALVVICAGILATGRWMDRRPVFYRGRHRWPSQRHPAHAAWLEMQQVDEAQLSAAYDRCMADLDALLEQEAR